MNNTQLIIWIVVGFDGLILLGAVGWLMWITWFDNKLRVIMLNSRYGLSIKKVKMF